MTDAGLDGDLIVGLIGVMAAMFLLSRNGSLQRLPWRNRLRLGLIWAAIFGVGVLLVSLAGS